MMGKCDGEGKHDEYDEACMMMRGQYDEQYNKASMMKREEYDGELNKAIIIREQDV